MKINAKENLMKGGLFNMLERQKEIVVEVGKYLFERGFTQLSGGNISVRDPQTNLVAIKPSGVAYGVMKPEDIIIVDINGNVVEGSLSPSIETGMHTGVYRNRPDVNAVIHCHHRKRYDTTAAGGENSGDRESCFTVGNWAGSTRYFVAGTIGGRTSCVGNGIIKWRRTGAGRGCT